MSNIQQMKYLKKKSKERFETEQEQKRRTRQTNDRIYNAFQSVTYIPNGIVDMKDALLKV